MKFHSLFSAAAVTIFALACQQQEPATKTESVRTIEDVQGASVPVQPLPSLEEQVGPVTTTSTASTAEDRQAAAKAQEEALARRMDLPFAPAIAMDPVDGQKVSITTLTPTTEYKNKIYYFSSEANKRQFLSNPEPFAKGQLARY